MSAALKRQITSTEYLALERAAEFRSELYRGEIVAMAGASRFHNRVKENLSIELGSRIRKGPCQSFSSETKVYIERTGNAEGFIRHASVGGLDLSGRRMTDKIR